MIPKLIHQTWKTAQIPGNLAAYEESWQRHNPSWRRILWTDRMLVDFVAEHYPDLLELYCSYPTPVCRADAARYMLLHTFGGLYADIDVECLAPLTPLIDEERAVLCHEPPNLWPETAPYRSHPFILFNGVMASPAGHPFWRHVLDRLPETRHGTSVIDMTGPCFLTGVYLGLDDTKDIAVHSCHLFTPTDREQTEAPPYGDDPAPDPLTRHHWEGSWVWKAGRKKWLRRALTSGYHRLRYHLQKGPVLDLDDVKRRIGPDVLNRDNADSSSPAAASARRQVLRTSAKAGWPRRAFAGPPSASPRARPRLSHRRARQFVPPPSTPTNSFCVEESKTMLPSTSWESLYDIPARCVEVYCRSNTRSVNIPAGGRSRRLESFKSVRHKTSSMRKSGCQPSAPEYRVSDRSIAARGPLSTEK